MPSKSIRNLSKLSQVLVLGSLVALCISCSNTARPNEQNLKPNSAKQPGDALISTSKGTNTDGKRWVPLRTAADTLGLNYDEQGDGAKIGYTDVMYEVHEDQKHGKSMGRSVKLENSPIRQNGQLCLTPEDISRLIGASANWNNQSGKLEVGRIPPLLPPAESSKPESIKTLSSVNVQELIAYAKKFMGVNYEFGAEDYSQSKTFDCSSFTRHVFRHFGVELPRLASEQAKEGSAVERSGLKPGDLIFFTVPGRFKDDRIPGHVGIYTGNGMFIHTWGEPGVEVSSLDTGYWSKVILSMRRVL